MLTNRDALRISLVRNGREIDCFVAHSGEGAVQLAVEMLRQAKFLQVGDQMLVELLSDFMARMQRIDNDTVSQPGIR